MKSQRGQRKSGAEQLDFMYNMPKPSNKEDSNSNNNASSAMPKNNLSHPILKNAPKEGDYVNKLDIKNYRPLGVQIRNVRCVRCGQNGHASGDRECPLSNINPNDNARKRAEDPAAFIHLAGSIPYSDNLIIKDHIRKEHQGEDRDLLPDESEESDPEKKYLDSLSVEEKKKLLKALKKDSKRKSKKHRKEKRRSKEKRQRSAATEDESSQDHKRLRSDSKKP